MMNTTLKENLKEWTDFDVAAYLVGCAIGLFPPFDGSYDDFRKHKGFFGTAGTVGEPLAYFLESLVDAKVLESDPGEIKYRWNPNFTLG